MKYRKPCEYIYREDVELSPWEISYPSCYHESTEGEYRYNYEKQTMTSHIFSMKISSIERSPHMTDIKNNSKEKKPNWTMLGIHNLWEKIWSSYRKKQSEEKWHEEKNPIKSGIIEKPFWLLCFHKNLSLKFAYLRILYREILYTCVDDFPSFFGRVSIHIAYVEVYGDIVLFRKSMNTHMWFS